MLTGGQSAPAVLGFLSPTSDGRTAEPVQLKVYPNPLVTGNLTIHIEGQTETAKIEVFTQQGQHIYSGEITRGGTVHLTNTILKQGIYLVYIKGKDLTEIRKVIVP